MNTPEAPRTPGKWVVYLIETGERFERWPIDAKGMLATGAYTRKVPGTGVAGPLPVAPGLDPKSIKPGVNPVPHVAAAEKALETSPHKLMQEQPQEAPVEVGPGNPPPETVAAPSQPVATQEQGEEVAVTEPALPEWTMPSYTPERYLKRWPEGPQAELARAIVERQQK